MTACNQSFDGLLACSIRDTTFYNNSVAKKGGAVIVATGGDDGSSTVEFHQCIISNNTAGDGALLDDPQGEGGAIVVGDRALVLLTDCVAENNWAGKKVPYVAEDPSSSDAFRIGVLGSARYGTGG